MKAEIIRAIQGTPYKFYCAIAGGGQTFIGDYCEISGASKNFVGGIVPYDKTLFNNFIGGTVEHYASSEAARKLAVASYRECLKTGINKQLAIGLGAASSIASEGERPGRKHKFFIAIHCSRFTSVLSYVIEQGQFVRYQEEYILESAISQQLANAILATPIAGFDEIRFPNCTFDPIEYQYEIQEDKNIGYLINRETDLISSENLAPLAKIVVYGGSFNPMHAGHEKIYSMAEEILGPKCFLELTVNNADKGFLDFIEVENRLNEIGNRPFILTNSPTIKEKVDVLKKYSPLAELFFVMGSDTWNRMWNPKYGYSIETLETFFAAYKVKFLVIPRLGHPAVNTVGQDFLVKSPVLDAYQAHDLSSTQIRKEQDETSGN